jgi:coenzyme F420 hydrogenase subunit beta
LPGLGPEWGTVLEIWEGHACDPEVRFKGSSGGALTALSLYCLEQLGMKGVLHTGEDSKDPVRNTTRLSRSRDDLLAATGSRYSPASVCNGLNLIEAAGGECAFIGRPAEVASLAKSRRIRPQLDMNTGAVYSFFCAETPATQGTLALLEKLGVNSNSLGSLRYRGEGWPGHFLPVLRGECEPAARMPYRESWAFLQAFRPWSVHLWPDSTGELADIVCGDPWYITPDGENPGLSLIVIRTGRGKEIITGAIEKGYLKLRPAEPWKMIKSQEGLVTKKGAVWGRLLAMRLFGLPVPSFRGGNLFRCWLRLPAGEKAKSILGTIRRIIQRKLYRPLTLNSEKGLPIH